MDNQQKIELLKEEAEKYAEAGNYEEAIRCYDEIIKLDPEDSEIYYDRGNTYSNLEKYEEAIQDFKKVLELDPEDRDGLCKETVILDIEELEFLLNE